MTFKLDRFIIKTKAGKIQVSVSIDNRVLLEDFTETAVLGIMYKFRSNCREVFWRKGVIYIQNDIENYPKYLQYLNKSSFW